jgi:hypothetical protein
MKKVKYMIGTVGASLVLALGLAVPASAQDVSERGDGDLNNTSFNLGPCAGVITSTVVQAQTNTATNVQANVGTGTGANVGDGAGVGAVDQNNTSSTSATGNQSAGVTFNPNCSTQHVTHVNNHHVTAEAKARHHVKSAGYGQVSRTPSGAVHAGAGGAASSNFAAVAGVVGSLSTAGLGLALRSRLQ